MKFYIKTILRKSYCKWLIFTVLILLTSRCSDELGEATINGIFIKTYLFDTREATHNLVVDAKNTADGGILIFGVSGNVENRIDGTGNLYLHKIDTEGNTEWYQFYTETGTGFPSNVIQEADGKYTIFWNSSPGELNAISIAGDLSQPPLIEKIEIDTKDISLKYITSAKRFTENDSYLILGLADFVDNNQTYKQIYVLELDNNFTLKFKPSGQEYNPDAFGGFGGEDRELIKRIDNYFHLEISDNQVFFSAPYNENIALKSLGNTKTIFQDNNLWIAALINHEQRKISLIVNNPAQQDAGSFYIPEIDLEPNSSINFDELQASATIHQLREMDTQKRIVIKKLKNNHILIAGTTQLERITLTTFSDKGELLSQKTIGQQNPYEVIQILESEDGNTISITGTTKANQEFRRAFLIKIPVSELL